MKRLIEKDIKKWMDEETVELLITGARQVGKTYTIRKCLQEANKNYVEFNFWEHPEYIGMFEKASGAQEVLLRLSAIAGDKMVPGETIIFFDEIQEYQEIATIIKFLVDEGSYRYIMSGSLLGVELKDVRSVPVGYLRIKDMYPMSLKEFFMALHISEDVFEMLKEHYRNRMPADSFIHERLMQTVFCI